MIKRSRIPLFIVLCGLMVQQTASAGFITDLLIDAYSRNETNREVAQAPDCTLTADQAYTDSITLLSDGCQAEAEDLITSAVKSYPDDVALLFAHAVLKRSRWSKQEAAIWFKVLQRKEGAPYLHEAAKLCLELDRAQNSAEKMPQLIQLSDENPDDLYLLWLSAFQCRNRKMGKTGAQRYEQLLEKFEIGPVLLHQTYANILTDDLQQYEKALPHRRLAVSMEAREWSLNGLAYNLQCAEQYNEANAVYARLIRIAPKNTEYINSRGDTLFELDRFKEAAEMYRRSLQLRPTTSAWDDLSRTLYELNCYDEGLAAAEEALKMNPKYHYAWSRKGNHLESMKRYPEAVEAFQQAVKYGNQWSVQHLAWMYQIGRGVEKNGAKSFELYQRYIAQNPGKGFAHRSIGNCYDDGIGTEEDPEKALFHFKKAVELDPNDDSSLNSLAWFYATCKDESFRNYPEAVKLARQSIAIKSYVQNIDTLVVALEHNQQIEEAIVAQEQLIQLWKKNNPDKENPKNQQKRITRLQNKRQK
jgi:tetratricopeptide (TPR) repeat protein